MQPKSNHFQPFYLISIATAYKPHECSRLAGRYMHIYAIGMSVENDGQNKKKIPAHH